MRLDRSLGPPPERTFAELFPWRNIRRALMLVAVIVAIVSVKRSAGPLLHRVTALVSPAEVSAPVPAAAAAATRAHTVRLGPGLLAPPAGVAGEARSPSTLPSAPVSAPVDVTAPHRPPSAHPSGGR